MLTDIGVLVSMLIQEAMAQTSMCINITQVEEGSCQSVSAYS